MQDKKMSLNDINFDNKKKQMQEKKNYDNTNIVNLYQKFSKNDDLFPRKKNSVYLDNLNQNNTVSKNIMERRNSKNELIPDSNNTSFYNPNRTNFDNFENLNTSQLTGNNYTQKQKILDVSINNQSKDCFRNSANQKANTERAHINDTKKSVNQYSNCSFNLNLSINNDSSQNVTKNTFYKDRKNLVSNTRKKNLTYLEDEKLNEELNKGKNPQDFQGFKRSLFDENINKIQKNKNLKKMDDEVIDSLSQKIKTKYDLIQGVPDKVYERKEQKGNQFE